MVAKIVEEPTLRERVQVFRDRFQAGKLLAEKLREYCQEKNAIVLAIPAGGIPVGNVIAKELAVPMDVVIVRKTQIPWNTEAGFGAVTWDGETILNEPLVEQLGLTNEEIEESISKAKRNVQERLRKFRGDKCLPQLRDKIIILVDDGLASGFTMLAAVRSARKSQPKKIIVAVPTASLGAVELLMPEVDEIVCLNIRSGPSFAVAAAYENWYDLTDEDALRILFGKGK
ncbi:MAG: phosphoribosyltransferase family protein [Candidatus Bathyarchaeia archaeon]|jgi:predicted phosphoribosyltransferase